MKDCLQNIEDIARIYYLKIKNNTLGTVIFTTINVFLLLVIISFIFTFIPKLKKYYMMYSTMEWIIYLIASFLILYSVMTKFGKPTETKCQAFILMLLVGFAMLYIRSIELLIDHYYKSNNRIINWIRNNKKLAKFIICFFDIFIISLSLFFPSMKPVAIYTNKSKNFYQCQITTSNIFGFALLIFVIIFHIGLFITLAIFIILDWNVKSIHVILKNLLYFLTFDGFSFFLVFLIQIINKSNYYIECICPFIVLFVFIAKHIFLFIINVWFDNRNANKKEKEKEKEEEEENVISEIHIKNDGGKKTDMAVMSTNISSLNNLSKYDNTLKSILQTNHFVNTLENLSVSNTDITEISKDITQSDLTLA